MRRRGHYHHGNLRSALVDASFSLLAEGEEFSVAKVARRVGVSTASPYRHFADRDHLLAAVASVAACELAARVQAIEADDPRERLALCAGVYVRYVFERGTGLNVIFSTSLEGLDDPEPARRLMSLLLSLAQDVVGSPEGALDLLERVLVTAHGYATLHRDGFFKLGDTSLDAICERAVRAADQALKR